MSWSAPAPGHRRLSRSTTGRRALRAGAIATAVAAMLCTYIVVVVTRADAAETLLSQGKPTTASTTDPSYPPECATDGFIELERAWWVRVRSSTRPRSSVWRSASE